jgi:hypothetical protein
MKAIDTLKGIVSDLTSLLIGVVGLGVVAGIVFGGNVAFFKTFLMDFLELSQCLAKTD